MQENARDKLLDYMLLLAALMGLGLAGLAALTDRSSGDMGRASGAIARVNDSHIDRTRFARAYQALLADKSNAPTAGDKKLVLDRLVEEELLVQRGLEIGLVDGDASVRKSLAKAVIEFVLAQSDKTPISDDAMRHYYQTNKHIFVPSDRLQVERVFVRQFDEKGAKIMRDADLLARLDQIRNALLAGRPFAQIAAQWGDSISPKLPRTILLRHKMLDYLGPTLTNAAARLPSGAISDAIADGGGWHFLHVVHNQPGKPPDFEALRPQLRDAMMRQRDDQALRDYLAWLKQRANISLAEDAPQ